MHACKSNEMVCDHRKKTLISDVMNKQTLAVEVEFSDANIASRVQ